MTALTQLSDGARVSASLLRSVKPLAAYKASSQSVVSSTTLQNDSALFVPVPANAIYWFQAFIAYAGFTQNASDLKFMWSVPSGASMTWEPTYLNTSGAQISNGANAAGAVIVAGTNGVSNFRAITGCGTLAVGGTPGNFQLQWAQNTSVSTATIIQTGSTIELFQVQ
jgi:hypothetical protein